MNDKNATAPEFADQAATRTKSDDHGDVPGESREETMSDEKAGKALRAIAEVSAKLPRNG